ncbi:MAG: hypothetical protein E1N59_463 [Puniceicoccaceae bacterium 5H]|nr:MAG: hypothetical protein E1N59_463 [Puniceicoccaceae bacterium 5H]
MSIQREIQKRRWRQLLLLAIVLPALTLFVSHELGLHVFHLPKAGVFSLAFLFVCGGAILTASNWRCPVCRTYLGGSINPERCRGCGRRLRGVGD